MHVVTLVIRLELEILDEIRIMYKSEMCYSYMYYKCTKQKSLVGNTFIFYETKSSKCEKIFGL